MCKNIEVINKSTAIMILNELSVIDILKKHEDHRQLK